MGSRTRWYLEQARRYVIEAIEGRARLGDGWASDPVVRAGLTHLVEAVAEYLGHVPCPPHHIPEVSSVGPDRASRARASVTPSARAA